MKTKWIAWLLGSVLGAAAFANASYAQQTFPDPKDDAALFANAKSKEGGKLVWYLNQPLEPLRVIADEFEKTYPGMHIDMQRLIGTQAMQRFVREADAKQDIADVLQISDPVLMKELGDKGYLAHWKVPTFDRIPDSFKIGDLSYTIIITDMAILYNTNKLTKEEVDYLQADWHNVADPKFKGRFAVSDHKCGICYTGVAFFLDPTMKEKYGVPFLTAVAKNTPAIYADSVVAIDRVIAGEHDFLFWFTEGPGVSKYMSGAPMKWIEPSPRPAYANAIQGISATAPHPNGARLFQNWLNSEAGAKALQEKYGVRTALEGIADTRAIAKEPWFPHPKDFAVDFDRWAKEYDTSQDIWIKALSANRER